LLSALNPGYDRPTLSPKFERYFPCRNPFQIQIGESTAAAAAIKKL
jgi:hypothetical protein